MKTYGKLSILSLDFCGNKQSSSDLCVLLYFACDSFTEA